MTDPTDGIAPLSVETDLDLTVNGVEAEVESTGSRVFVNFPSVPEALRALRGQPLAAGSPLSTVLRATDLTVEVRVRHRTVAVAGADARPGPLSRSLEADPFEVRAGGAAGAVLAEVTDAVDTLRGVLG